MNLEAMAEIQALREQRSAQRKQPVLAAWARLAEAKAKPDVTQPAVVPETVEEWMARTGQSPEIL